MLRISGPGYVDRVGLDLERRQPTDFENTMALQAIPHDGRSSRPVDHRSKRARATLPRRVTEGQFTVM